MIKKIESSYAPFLLKVMQNKYPFIKKIMGDGEEMIYTVYLDIVIIIDCEKFLKFYDITDPSHLDDSFLNKTTYNFHFALSTLFTLLKDNRGKEVKIKSDGEEMKRRMVGVANMILRADEEFMQNHNYKEVQVHGAKFYFDCDNIF